MTLQILSELCPMSRRALSPFARIVWLSSLGVALLLVAEGARAQSDSLGSVQEIEKGKAMHLASFEALLRGEQQPGPDDQAVMDAFAQYYVLLMTHPTYQNKKGKLYEIVTDLDTHLKDYALLPENAARNQKFMEQWTERMVLAFRRVTGPELLEGKANQNRVTVVRVAMLLPVFAKAKQEKFSEFLGSILTDEKQHDVMKLYAVKALRAYFPARPARTTDDPDDKKLQQTIARDARRVKAVMDFLGRKWDTTEPQVAQYIRREALRTLAEAQVPAMQVKDGKVQLPVAQALLRTLAHGKEGLSPPPSLTEKCEAAIGVCKMKAKLLEDYQPEAGLYLVGRFLDELITEYTKDFPRFGAKGKGAVKHIPVLPWKLEADRLQKALKELETNLMAGTPTHAKALKLAEAAKNSLGGMASHLQVDQPRDLRTLLGNLRPANGQLFKGIKGIEIDLSAPATE
jgi:hypothetical protein